MKKSLLTSIIFALSFIFISCETKDPVEPGVQFSLDPKLNQTYFFEKWMLDSLDMKREGPIYYFESCRGKNLTIGGKSDALLSTRYIDPNAIDSVYLRIENGKDLYEWVDTSQIFFNGSSRTELKKILNKITKNYVWLPRVLLSKGDGAEYSIMPKKFFTIRISPDTTINASIEAIGKNEGFENVTVPLGTFKAYKVKNTLKVEIFLAPAASIVINFVQFFWISDDLDWWIKQFIPTVKSPMLGVIQLGELYELRATQSVR